MTLQTELTELLRNGFTPDHLNVINESHKHNVPADAEMHFHVTIISDQFKQKTLVQRHQCVYQVLGSFMKKIHALTMATHTPDEWQAQGGKIHQSPPCEG